MRDGILICQEQTILTGIIRLRMRQEESWAGIKSSEPVNTKVLSIGTYHGIFPLLDKNGPYTALTIDFSSPADNRYILYFLPLSNTFTTT